MPVHCLGCASSCLRKCLPFRHCLVTVRLAQGNFLHPVYEQRSDVKELRWTVLLSFDKWHVVTRVPDLDIKLQFPADECDNFIPFVRCKLMVVGSFIVLTLTFQRLRKVKLISYPNYSDFRKSAAFWNVPTHRLFVLVRATFRWRWGWNNCGTILTTGENRGTAADPCSNASLSVTNLTLTGLGSNPGVRGETSATDHLSHGSVLKGEN